MNSTKVGSVASLPSASVTDCAGVLVCAFNAKMVVVVLSIFPSLATTRTGSSASSVVLL